MAKKAREITKVPAGEIAPPPDFMKPDETAGLSVVKQYVTPRRLKIVQKSSNTELLDEFFVGDVIITPDNDLVVEMGRDDKGRPAGEGDGFLFTVVSFFVEYCTWNPFELKGRAPAIIDRSLNSSSMIARKAKSMDMRFEPHPTEANLKIRHVEHLNFLVLVEGRDDDLPVILTFDRGDHKAGRAFCDLIAMRKGPIYGGVYKADVNWRENEFGDWWGIDVGNPAIDESEPWVTEDRYPFLKKTHEYFAKLHSEELVRVNYEEDAPSETGDF